MLLEAADLAQNRPLWRMMSTYGATQSWVACQKRRIDAWTDWEHYWLGHLTRKIVSEMTYNVSSGTLNSTIPYLRTLYLCLPVLPASGIKATLATLLLACSETSPSYAPRSSRFGSEPPSVEDAVDVWCYAVVSCMPETMTKVELCNPCCLSVVYSFCLFVSRKLLQDDHEPVDDDDQTL